MRSFGVLTAALGVVFAFAAIAAVPVAASAAVSTTAPWDNQFAATCRLTAPGGSMGTGSVLQVNAQYVAVLTNYHVVRDDRSGAASKVVAAEFWTRGHQSEKLPGQVLCADPNLDAAIVLVPTAAFAGRVPAPIPLARATPSTGSRIRCVGCAKGTWATGFEGHITRADAMQFYFVPPPAEGRSGSAVTDERGEMVGLLRVRVGTEGSATQQGGAVRIEALWPRLQFIAHAAAAAWKPDEKLAAWVGSEPVGSEPVGSEPIGCGPNGCTPDSQEDMFGRRPNLFPGLWQPQRQAPTPQPSGAWPTAPQVLQAPATDLSPVISAINGLQDTLRQQSPAGPAPPQTCGPDPATAQALQNLNNQEQQHAAAIETLGKGQTALADGQAKIASQTEAIGKTANETREVVKKNGTLRERSALAEEQAREDDPNAGRAKNDLEAAKLMIHDHNTIALVLGAVCGIVLICGLVHWLRSGHGLVADVLLKSKNPQIHDFAEKLAVREESLHDKLPFLPHLGGLHPAVVAALAANPITQPAAAALTLADIQRLIEARLAPAPGAAPAAAAASPAVVFNAPATPAKT